MSAASEQPSEQRSPASLRRYLILTLKLAVLVAVLWFAISRLQFDDQLVLPEDAAARSGEGFEVTVGEAGPEARLRVDDAATVVLRSGDALDVLESPGEGAVTYEVVWRGAAPERRFAVPAAWVGEAGFLSFQPGIRSTLRTLDVGLLLFAAVCFGGSLVLLGWRWGLLLRAADIVLPFTTVSRLTFIGLFFNTFIPGGAGGDLVKAVAVGRYTDRHAEAVSLIVVDRILGLAVLLLCGLLSILVAFPGQTAMVVPAALLAVAMAVGTVLYFSHWFRRLIRFDDLLGLLPFSDKLRRADRAVFELRNRPRQLASAAAVAIGLQVIGILAISIAGRSLGLDQVRWSHYFFVVPVAYLFNAVPISPGGLGLLEIAFQQLLSQAGLASPSEGFMLGVLARLLLVLWGLPGLFLWLVSGERKAAKRAESDIVGTPSGARGDLAQ